MSDERTRLRHGEKEYELLPPDGRHAWLDPDADPSLAPPPAAARASAAARTSTRRTIVVSCIAAFVAGIATFAVVRALRDDGGRAGRRPGAAPATSAPARAAPTTLPSTTAPAANRPTTSTPSRSTPSTSAPGATTRPTTPASSAAPTATSRVVLGVTVSDGSDGVTIVSVASGSGADAAGLRPGDVFVSLDGKAIATTDDLGDAIGAHAAGDQVKIVVTRDGADVDVTATLGTTTE